MGKDVSVRRIANFKSSAIKEFVKANIPEGEEFSPNFEPIITFNEEEQTLKVEFETSKVKT